MVLPVPQQLRLQVLVQEVAILLLLVGWEVLLSMLRILILLEIKVKALVLVEAVLILQVY